MTPRPRPGRRARATLAAAGVLAGAAMVAALFRQGLLAILLLAIAVAIAVTVLRHLLDLEQGR